MGKLEKCQVNQVIKVINRHDKLYWHHGPLDMVHGKHYIIFRAFLAKKHNHSNVMKPLLKFTLRDSLQNNSSVLFRNVKAMKDNVRMRNCLKLERFNGEGSGTPLLPGTHSTLAWKIPWTEEPSGLQFTGSLRVGHNWATSLSLFTFMHWRRNWQPTPVFLPGESQGRGSLVVCRLGVAQSRTWLKQLSSSSNRY